MIVPNEVFLPLVGLPLSAAARAADMEMFSFGRLRRVKSAYTNRVGVRGECALHVQCPWQLTVGGSVLVSDRSLKSELERHTRRGLPENALTPSEMALEEYLRSTPELMRRVIDVSPYPEGSLRIVLEGRSKLEIMPKPSHGDERTESWRFFRTDGDSGHFVFQNGLLERVDP